VRGAPAEDPPAAVSEGACGETAPTASAGADAPAPPPPPPPRGGAPG
jgi:hypothetical protein